jgi:hypothetical protein
MAGGIRNPLGAKAWTTPSIASTASMERERTAKQVTSGCCRTTNGHVVDLAGRVSIGTRVIVVSPRAERRSIHACARCDNYLRAQHRRELNRNGSQWAEIRYGAIINANGVEASTGSGGDDSSGVETTAEAGLLVRQPNEHIHRIA